VAGRRLGVCGDRHTLIPVEDILYAFLGSAVSKRLIDAAWSWQHGFRRDRVYVRTRKGIFMTHFRSLAQLRARLNPEVFSPIHQSLLVSMNKIVEIDLGGRVKQVGVALADGSIESLTVSRRYVKALRFRLGLSTRG
jgi:hypothetical protein